jgi:two-component system sensor histidine kinase BaeS
MLVRFAFFLGFVMLMIVGMVVLVFQVISNVGDLSGWWALGAIPFILIVLAGRSFMRSWRPVRRLITAAGSLADGDYAVRVEPTGSGSMRAAMTSFNRMAGQLETADEQRRRLLADLGHEMRTPLTVVRGEIEAMLDGVHDVDAEHLGMLLTEVGVMERLLEDLRTLSLLDAGQLPLHPEPTDPVTLVEDVADGYRRRAAEAAVTVDVESTGSAELMLDPVRIREVLTNLADNALRAMPDGGRLGFTVTAAGAGATIAITDTGTGIAPEDLEQVFDRFHKGSTSRGSGLGLTISRDLVEAHGGTIGMTSEPGIGTTVRIELPGAA